MITKKKFKRILKNGLNKMEIEMNEKKLDIFWIYLIFLIEENKKYNLTGIEDPRKIIYKHFLDSLSIYSKTEFNKNDKVIDIGTGAGFPGVVLKIIFPDINLVLLDSRLKRVHFLKMLILNQLQRYNNISENIEIIHDRAEKLGHNPDYRENFDYVFSRAVAPLNILIEYVIPFIKHNKSAVLFKGNNFNQEINEAMSGINKLGAELGKIINIQVPGVDKERVLIFLKKVATTPDKFPRNPGIPKKRPL